MTHEEITPVLHVTTRTDDKNGALRRANQVPLVLYGEDITNRHLSADLKEVTKLLREFGETTLIDVVEGDKTVKVLFREPQLHPLSHQVMHLDLHQVNLKEKVTADVPIVFVGASPAVDNLGGTLIESKQEVEVEALPSDLPHELEVDITSLVDFDSTLHIRDLKVPAGVEILAEEDEIIASVAEPRSEEELAALDEAPEEVDVEAAVAVEEKGKEDGEEAPAEDAKDE